jgi:hypothetical protein
MFQFILNVFYFIYLFMCYLWKKTVHYHITKSTPPVPILNQTNTVHKVHLNIILSLIPWSS